MDVIQFDINQPVTVSLKYATGRETKPGRTGRRWMFTATDGRAMFFDEAETQAIEALKPQPGEPLEICKRKNGGAAAFWDIRRVGVPPQAVQAPAAAVTRISDKTLDQTQTITPEVEDVPLVKHTLMSSWMAGSYIAAMDAIMEAQKYAAAKGIVMKFSEESVQASANSIFIQFNRDRERGTIPFTRVPERRTTWRQ